MQITVVATARKLAVIVWHLLSKEQDYDWKRPTLTQNKLRRLELQAGCKVARGNRRSVMLLYLSTTSNGSRFRSIRDCKTD